MFKINLFLLVLSINLFYTCHVKGELMNLTGKIIDGKYVDIENYAYTAFMYVILYEGTSICGTSILNQYLMLTAAHCFDSANFAAKLYVYAGSDDVNEVTVSRRVIKIYIHEQYRKQDILNDITLLVLEKKLPFRSNIQRVFIKPNFPSYDKAPKMYLAGWGVINDKVGEKQSTYLKAVDQVMLSPRKCSQAIGRKFPGMFCARSMDHVGRPAEGDSGSGLVTADHQLVGILSFRSYRRPNIPFYTSIAAFYTWIEKMATRAELEYCSYNGKKRPKTGRKNLMRF